jgi:heterodisulfide reductase subunit A
MKNKIGVYICQCGSNISDYVDVEEVKDKIATIQSVALAKTTMFACADSAQKEIIQDIKDQQLDAIVIASCSPKLHLFTFRNVAIRAGLNPYNYVQVNIREQCSWAHSNNPAQATDKAVKLIQAGIERAKYSEALTHNSVEADNTIVIIGAGVAGLRAALELANMGTHVYLVEKDHFVGGRTAQWNKLFTTNETGPEVISTLYNEVKKTENITLFTGAEIVSNSGSVGNYEIKIKINPRLIKTDKALDQSKIEKAIEACPIEIDDPFDFNLTKHKAIYMNHPGQYPETPVIDQQACTKCKKCIPFLPEIDLEQKDEIITVKAGAVMLATGFDPYEPANGEFGYNESDQVITLQEFKRLIDLNDNQLTYNNNTIKSIAYIYCIGSRQTEGANKYCSRYCCSAAMHTATEAYDKFPGLQQYHLTRDIRTYGKQELIYHQALNNGDLIFQFEEETPPTIIKDNNSVIIKLEDTLTGGLEIELAVDMLVLVTGMVPRKDNSIADILKVPKGRDNFFNEVHPKLRPVETVIDGVFIAGACQSPKNISESMQSALSAASKANTLISKGIIELEPILALIDHSKCKWCDKCSEICPYDAISKSKENGKEVAIVHEAKCKGCGMCLPVCPENAIQLSGYTDAEIENMIEALIK